MKHVDRVIVCLLAGILILSGLDKILHYQGFLNALLDYVLVPEGAVPILAPVVITAELIIGLGLIVPAWRRQAAFASAALFLFFTAAVALNYALGGRGICGCWFTLTLAESTGLHIAQNLLMTALALSLVLGESDEQSPAPVAVAEGS